LAPDSIPRLNEVQVDGRVALFALGLTLVTSVFFGLVPARALSARTTAERLKSGRLVGGNRDRGRSALVVAELTLSIVLLLAAAVLTRSFIRLLAWDPGFDRSGVSVAWTLVPPAPGRNTQSAVALLERLREETAAVPGVVSAGLASGGPLFGGAETGVIDVAGAPPVPPDQAPTVNWYDVDPNYFRTLDRRVVAGRGFTAADVNGAPPTAMVNETLAARLFSGRSPLGQRVTVQGHAADIVGLVADVRPLRPDRGVPAEIFWPIRQFPRYGAYLIVRTAPGAPGVERAVNDRAAAIDPAIRLAAWTPLERQFDTALVSPRFNMLLLGVFALVAIGLAAIGLYGVIACSVATRTREIGVRMALGATSRDVVRGVVAGSARLALLAAGLGVTTTFALGRILSSVAYGVTVADPLVLAATLGGFAIVTLIAGYIPARRASRIDPLAALRSE
jgi:putative ABC transport system permease protein